MTKRCDQTWDLELIFPNGSASVELQRFIEQLQSSVDAFGVSVSSLNLQIHPEQLGAMVEQMQDIGAKMEQASAFVSCLEAQNVKDERARILLGKLAQLMAEQDSCQTIFDQKLLDLTDDQFKRVLIDPTLKDVEFVLTERRVGAARKLPAVQEGLISELAVDGYHGWSELYNTVVGRIQLEVVQDGQKKLVSYGQAANMLADSDGGIRQTIFTQLENAWSEQAELIAPVLNHLAGFRLNLYKKRGWLSILEEPLALNRMQAETLESMWSAVEYGKPKLVAYLERKAKLLGLEKLGWSDLEAPLVKVDVKIAYDDAATFIVERFAEFSPDMAELAQRAFDERWIEAEDRPGKRPGGFCTHFPKQNESRIFMTYSGTPQGVATLAHELGHAYHSYVVGKELPYLATGYAMNVAETASTFAELLVSDAAIRQSVNPEERLALLEDKLQNGVGFLMNIHARFLFETRFYEKRKAGQLTVEQLNALMIAAQKEGYSQALTEYHPHFWASKLHFYLTDYPFYNFPYTFGYLFSIGLYARALEEGKGFADKYQALLRDTGQMTVEDLAQKHLNIDLTKPEFWQGAVKHLVCDVDEFLALTECK